MVSGPGLAFLAGVAGHQVLNDGGSLCGGFQG